MQVFHTDYSTLGLWSHTDLAYIQHDPLLKHFMTYTPEVAAFPGILESRKKFEVDRGLLLSVIKKQYENLGMALPENVNDLLDENTFTVTTAHQPALLTGPLYHIYKIASTIHLAKDLNQALPGNKIIPFFIVSGEDHDWEEINHLYLFGRKYQWERQASGPCGRLSLEGLSELIKSVEEVFANSPHREEIIELLEGNLNKAQDYGQYHQLLVHTLFSRHGLIVLNMDDPDLKRAFVPLMQKEISERFSAAYVPATQSALESKGFKAQAFCRPVNLFYLSDQRRERIDPSGDGFLKVESGITNTKAELLDELSTYPDRFSPNVIFRPLYQELILPNLAYVGGGGEIAYWLERKSQFEAAGIHYPMLVRRNSLLMIDESSSGIMQKSDLTWEDILPDLDTIIRKFLKSHSQAELDFAEELKLIVTAFHSLAGKADKIDPTLSKAILAEETKQSKAFEQLGSRLLRAEKQLQDTNIKRIQKLKEKLFPANGLQERHENFLTFYAQYGDAWIDSMISICDPMNEKFTVLEFP
jgi:bacillithiol biosynthesis cysteine-adding enzyme BshC